MDNKVVCKYCGEMIDSEAGFCPVCGAVNKTSFRPDPNKVYCKFCGAEITGTEEYCLVCGTPVRRKVAGGSDGKHSSIDNIVPELKKKAETGTFGTGHIGTTASLNTDINKANEPLNFLQKAALKQQKDAAREEELEKRRLEETKAFNEEKEKLRASATQVFGENTVVSQSTKQFDGGRVEPKGDSDRAGLNDQAAEAGDSDMERLKDQAAEAGVSVEEMQLFEQVKAKFESENETYPDDYNVNDYAQFDYAESRYGSYNLGSLELERIEYENHEKQAEESLPHAKEDGRKESREESSDQGVIGTKKKKTPLVLRILFFFIAIFAVAGLAGIILYIVPAVRQAHPMEMLMDESVAEVELTITPIVAATSTPTPTLTPTPTMTPTPTVDAILPQSITPTQELTEEVYAEYEEKPETTEPIPTDIEISDSGYIVSDSDYRIMDPSELDGRSPEEIRLIANEIYARYGCSFENEAYADYFGQFDWYDPIYDPGDFPDEILSDAAQANLDMIAEYEAQHGY